MIKRTILKGWNFMRLLRLAVGIFMIVQGFQTNEWMFVVLGGLFSLMPLLNLGCCGSMSCQIPAAKTNNEVENITHEEVR